MKHSDINLVLKVRDSETYNEPHRVQLQLSAIASAYTGVEANRR